MTPQTPQGAALSDADIDQLVKDIHDAIAELAGVARYPDLTEAIERLASCAAADRRLTAEQGGADLIRQLESAQRYATNRSMAVTREWVRGWDACLDYAAAAITTQPQAEPVEDPIQERVLLRAAQPQAEPAASDCFDNGCNGCENCIDEDESTKPLADALTLTRWNLKNGEYNGADIMRAWLAIDELLRLRATSTAPTEPT